MEHQSGQGRTQVEHAYTEGFMAMDCAAGSPILEDLLSLSGLLNFDGFNEPSLCSLTSDFLFSSSNYSSMHPMSPSSLEQSRVSKFENEGISDDVNHSFSTKFEAQKPMLQLEFSPNLVREGEFGLDSGGSQIDSAEKDVKGTSSVIFKSVETLPFSDRLLKALSLLKEPSGGGILAQIWLPVKQGDNYMLSTCEQPFLLDHALTGYREVSRVFTFSTKETLGMFHGVPGRVFISGLPEWTSNINYYNKLEYLRVEYAISHEVRGSLAVPVFDPYQSRCCAVLELVTLKEKPNFAVEMENVCRALQAANFRTTRACAYRLNLTKDQRSALSEISDVLRAVCHAHMLPLALTWMPIGCNSGIIEDDCDNDDDEDGNATLWKGTRYLKEHMLCIQESACYVNDSQMHGFLHACAEHYLAKGQGIAGKALLSNHPFFSPDIKGYDIGQYPLVHHARKFGLQAAVAIRLRSTYSWKDDFVLEFFLPVNCKGSAEQQLLLNNLSVTMQRICRTLRTVLDAEVAGPDVGEVDIENVRVTNSHSSEMSLSMSKGNTQLSERNLEVADGPSHCQNMESDEQVKYGSQKQIDKKRSTSEKHISLTVLQKYFAGSLKDAAKSLGVCPTTLKRICRQHGISRWPSRKIKKVNHSLKKIQSVINSVQGVEGTLKYDPKTGCLVAAVSPESLNPNSPSSSSTWFADRQLDDKLELNNNKLTGQKPNSLSKFHSPNPHNIETNEMLLPNGCSTKSKATCSNFEISTSADMNGLDAWPLCSEGMRLTRDKCTQNSTDKRGLAGFVNLAPLNLDSVAEEDGMERNHPSGLSMSDSSSESTSCCPTLNGISKNESFVSDKGPVYTVKATYKADTVRFKLLPSMGCVHLYDEVGKRFKLSTGTFQLKYMDDEEEWVLLTTDSDLQLCIEVLESISSKNMKLQVRDMPCAVRRAPGQTVGETC